VRVRLTAQQMAMVLALVAMLTILLVLALG
jgi:hypothetical protein